jgi:hypothetical protein
MGIGLRLKGTADCSILVVVLYQGTTSVVPPLAKMVRALQVAEKSSDLRLGFAKS